MKTTTTKNSLKTRSDVFLESAVKNMRAALPDLSMVARCATTLGFPKAEYR
mgnify:CR=1 FL=1